VAPEPPLIPAAFAAGVVQAAGDDGRAWLAAVPGILARLCADWSLTPEEPVRYGYLSLVVPVRRADERLVLRVSRLPDTVAREALALTAWRGRGAVRLLAARPESGALLLERLHGDRSLHGLPITEAVAVVADLLRRLSIPAPAGLPRLARRARRWPAVWRHQWHRLGRPVPRRLLDAACDACAQVGSDAGTLLVHDDLHYGNVLAGDREPWLAIDPLPVVGDTEAGVAPLLWRRHDEPDGTARRFATVVDVAGLDRGRTRAWSLARTVDYWLWAVGVGLTRDPVICHRVAAWLAGPRPRG
jgi:streptomycin 6-kinase